MKERRENLVIALVVLAIAVTVISTILAVVYGPQESPPRNTPTIDLDVSARPDGRGIDAEILSLSSATIRRADCTIILTGVGTGQLPLSSLSWSGNNGRTTDSVHGCNLTYDRTDSPAWIQAGDHITIEFNNTLASGHLTFLIKYGPTGGAVYQNLIAIG